MACKRGERSAHERCERQNACQCTGQLFLFPAIAVPLREIAHRQQCWPDADPAAVAARPALSRQQVPLEQEGTAVSRRAPTQIATAASGGLSGACLQPGVHSPQVELQTPSRAFLGRRPVPFQARTPINAVKYRDSPTEPGESCSQKRAPPPSPHTGGTAVRQFADAVRGLKMRAQAFSAAIMRAHVLPPAGSRGCQQWLPTCKPIPTCW